MLSSSCSKKNDSNNPNLPPATVTDIDCNVYHTVTIGTQVWMVENLNVTHYRNGDPIPNITYNTAWLNDTTGAYSNYNNDVNYSISYGRLYNWYAVANNRKIAPAGWHVPTDAEWTVLTDSLGGDSIAGGKMKEAGTAHWLSPNTGATNSSGFTALPGGGRDYNGGFYYLTHGAYFWSSTEYSSPNAWYRGLGYGNESVGRYYDIKTDGFSVRCAHD